MRKLLLTTAAEATPISGAWATTMTMWAWATSTWTTGFLFVASPTSHDLYYYVPLNPKDCPKSPRIKKVNFFSPPLLTFIPIGVILYLYRPREGIYLFPRLQNEKTRKNYDTNRLRNDKPRKCHDAPAAPPRHAHKIRYQNHYQYH
jgi:hypothetical protein